MIDIGAMTTMLTGLLASDGLMVGDGVAPQAAGWEIGTPNSGAFVPYTVLTFDGAAPTHPDVDRADPEWQTRWSMRHHGGSRVQCDWTATASRALILSCLQRPFGTADVFRIIGITWSTLGGVSRNDTVDPPHWASADNLILTTSRVRNSR